MQRRLPALISHLEIAPGDNRVVGGGSCSEPPTLHLFPPCHSGVRAGAPTTCFAAWPAGLASIPAPRHRPSGRGTGAQLPPEQNHGVLPCVHPGGAGMGSLPTARTGLPGAEQGPCAGASLLHPHWGPALCTPTSPERVSQGRGQFPGDAPSPEGLVRAGVPPLWHRPRPGLCFPAWTDDPLGVDHGHGPSRALAVGWGEWSCTRGSCWCSGCQWTPLGGLCPAPQPRAHARTGLISPPCRQNKFSSFNLPSTLQPLPWMPAGLPAAPASSQAAHHPHGHCCVWPQGNNVVLPAQTEVLR